MTKDILDEKALAIGRSTTDIYTTNVPTTGIFVTSIPTTTIFAL